MPKKPGQERRKKLSRSKRKELRSMGAVPQQPVAQTAAAVAPPPKVSIPVVVASTSKITQTAAQRPYVVGELKRIGIMGGIILVILVVLAVALT